ncbi:hypothetical protein R69749_06467 [Paraburkholderia domus]|nr:hypothetical protein R70006_02569 [Paraburkholderia domus]CAE6873867.1 hypothetical protein R69749_06467 [Paraburkholderia domus]
MVSGCTVGWPRMGFVDHSPVKTLSQESGPKADSPITRVAASEKLRLTIDAATA